MTQEEFCNILGRYHKLLIQYNSNLYCESIVQKLNLISIKIYDHALGNYNNEYVKSIVNLLNDSNINIVIINGSIIKLKPYDSLNCFKRIPEEFLFIINNDLEMVIDISIDSNIKKMMYEVPSILPYVLLRLEIKRKKMSKLPVLIANLVSLDMFDTDCGTEALMEDLFELNVNLKFVEKMINLIQKTQKPYLISNIINRSLEKGIEFSCKKLKRWEKNNYIQYNMGYQDSSSRIEFEWNIDAIENAMNQIHPAKAIIDFFEN